MAGTMTRRALVGGGVFAVVGAGAVASDVVPGRSQLKADLKDQYHAWFSPHPRIPDAPEGWIRLEQVRSRARGKTVDLFTAVPHGHGDGAGLPVRVILHSVSAPPQDYHGASVATDDGVYRTTPLGMWCGRSDPQYDDVRAFVARLPRRPQVLSYGDGAHTRAYWDVVTPPAFAFVAGELEKAA